MTGAEALTEAETAVDPGQFAESPRDTSRLANPRQPAEVHPCDEGCLHAGCIRCAEGYPGRSGCVNLKCRPFGS
jgi:hypothetical protein